MINRRQFGIQTTAALMCAGLTGQSSAEAPASTNALSEGRGHTADNPVRLPYFFKHPTFEFVYLMSLGRAYQMAGNIGKVLYLGRQIEDGNFESAYTVFKQAGDEALAIADESAAGGHRESARQAYLWAQNFYDSSTYFIDGSLDAGRFYATWALTYDCWLKAAPLFDPPIESVSIPYEGTVLKGFFMRAAGSPGKRPLLILNNGSDGSLLDMWVQGGSAAVARGYNCLTFDGPGQGYALWKQKLHFRPDWEKVITPVVDYALSRKDVDSKRIALQGISQGGYWVPRALAFEKRIFAGIADPGVVDVSTSWLKNLPPPMIDLLKAGRKPEFDGYLAKSLNSSAKAYLQFRMRPYGFDSYYDVFRSTQEYHLRDVVEHIQAPMLITSPANEDFWPGQSRELFDHLKSPKLLVEFTTSDGADLHCEPKGVGLRDLRVFNWLDDQLARRG
jgi:hypothetical protein